MIARQRSQIILLYLFVRVVWCIPLNQFYPYGPYAAEAVNKIAKGNDAFSPMIFTQTAFYFFGQQRHSLIVSVNGALSFYEAVPEFTTSSFPLGDNREIIAPFWADVDTSRKGNVWYHESSNPVALKRASEEVLKAYPEANYTAKNLFIATWDQVGYYNAATTKTNTFQCVLTTDGIRSYTIFLYADGEMKWTTGDADGGINGLGGIPAQVGFNKGDGINFATINKSRTQDIIKVASASNTGISGVLIFKISDEDISTSNLTFTNGDDDDKGDATFNAKSRSEAEYYLSYFMNYDGGNASISILTSDSQPVSYFIEAPGIDVYNSGTVTANNEVKIYFPSIAEVTSHVEQNKGIYLKTTSSDVIVIGHNRDPNGYTTDTFLALPTNKLSVKMYVYYGISAPRSVLVGKPNVILIVGTEGSTTMNLIVTQSVTVSVGSTTTDISPGKQYSFVINRLQTIYIESVEDLSGTKVVTDKPISMYSGHVCANIPSDVSYCDYLVEQMPPTALWGKVYYVVPLATRRSFTIKILAAYDSTNISVYCNNSLKSSYTINEGKYINIVLELQEYCSLRSNKEVLVVQFGHGYVDDNIGDPMMTLLPATTQYGYHSKFSTLIDPININYQHFVNIIVIAPYYQPHMIYLTTGGVQRSLDTQQWVPIKVNNIVEAYATKVNLIEGITEIVHSDKAALMMTTVYGFATFEGYGHPGGVITHEKTTGPPPIFVLLPTNQSIDVFTNNHNISLSCEANGTLSYIWDRQNGDIPFGAIGRNNSTLTLINVQPEDSGNYQCVATNNYGAKTSGYAAIMINDKRCDITNISGVITMNKTAVTITFSANDLTANFQCRLDDEKLSPCSNPRTWRNVRDGKHFIIIVANCPEVGGKRKMLKKKFKFQVFN